MAWLLFQKSLSLLPMIQACDVIQSYVNDIELNRTLYHPSCIKLYAHYRMTNVDFLTLVQPN